MKLIGLMPIRFDPAKSLKWGSLKQLCDLTDGVILLNDNGKDLNYFVNYDQTTVVLQDYCGDSFRKILEVVNCSRLRDDGWQDYGNRLTLLTRAAIHGADWVLWLDDDLIFHPDITPKAMRLLVDLAKKHKCRSVSFTLREMWNESHWRSDGIWRDKRYVGLANNLPVAQECYTAMSAARLHVLPTAGGAVFCSDAEVFHYGMSTPELRTARLAKYQREDPENRFQADYQYLVNEDGLQLTPLCHSPSP